MKREFLKMKGARFYFVILAEIVAIISLIRFLMWAPNHGTMDTVIVAALIVGMAADSILLIKNNDYLMVFSTACYSVALVKLLVNSVGSFVDAFQGIQMFGDATQVKTILSLSEVMAVGVLLSIIASFLSGKRKNKK